MSTPTWRGVESIGLLCRVNAEDAAQAEQLRASICGFALARLQTILGESFSIDALTMPDSRVLEPDRVTLILNARLQWHEGDFTGHSLTVSSRQFRHKSGAPPGALFFEAPSVVILPSAKQTDRIGDKVPKQFKPLLELHLRSLLR